MVAPLIGVNAAASLIATAVLIAALVLNIIILNEVNKEPAKPDDATAVTTTSAPASKGCAASGKISSDTGFADAATQLLRGLDRRVDPCDDFFAFTCNSFVNNKDEPSSSVGGSQRAINNAIADHLMQQDETVSKTEKIARNAYRTCTDASTADRKNPNLKYNRTWEVNKDINATMGFPFFGNSKELTKDTLWETVGTVERQFGVTILLGSFVRRDLAVENTAALYIEQAPLALGALDYYVLPSFISNLQDYARDLEDMLTDYQKALNLTVANCPEGKTDADCIKEKASWVVEFERNIAMASWPLTEIRNSEQQYNPHAYADLPDRYPGISLQKYINKLLADIDIPLPLTQNVVVNEPTYLAWVSSMLESQRVSVEQLTDYLAITFLTNSADYHLLGSSHREKRRAERKDKKLTGLDTVQPQVLRKGRRLSKQSNLPMHALETPDDINYSCINTLMKFMPYGPGYVYVKNRSDRDEVVKDVTIQTNYVIEALRNMVDTLEWMTDKDKTAAKAKLDPANLIQNIGWPTYLFGNFDAAAESNLDDYHVDYAPLLLTNTYWETTKVYYNAFQTREWFRMLLQTTNAELRRRFLQSPAEINAWYQPELNSITFPMAAFVPPYYDLSYPQAYRYAGQGGTGGHELTHGLDDQGIQYGPNGLLVGCDYATCGILSSDSRSGFTDMAQCVVQQYNMQCCPVKSGNVRCVNGATTQGENIADIGGELAAYNAYKMWVKNENGGNGEDLLPEIEDFTLNQVFWITYGFSWCKKSTDEELVNQLLTNPHSPSVCRVNQVVQDIPQFGRDFKCKRGTTEFPLESDRCKVWTSLG